jgi:hypothetical protein
MSVQNGMRAFQNSRTSVSVALLLKVIEGGLLPRMEGAGHETPTESLTEAQWAQEKYKRGQTPRPASG